MSDHLTQNATAFATEKGLSTPIPIFVGGDYNTSLNRANTALTTLENRTNSFRNANIFHEEAVNHLLNAVVEVAKPRKAEVIGRFRPRGGIAINVKATMGGKIE